ncbi:MAG: hypothetical protein COB02_10455 [Candidatus Cloacimonadota bacterium]|nr:MAG: hypothetical protein COB02_10455 [Candidatus Cloacimonadota bacterium]
MRKIIILFSTAIFALTLLGCDKKTSTPQETNKTIIPSSSDDSNTNPTKTDVPDNNDVPGNNDVPTPNTEEVEPKNTPDPTPTTKDPIPPVEKVDPEKTEEVENPPPVIEKDKPSDETKNTPSMEGVEFGETKEVKSPTKPITKIEPEPSAKVVLEYNFMGQRDGSATKWLTQNGFTDKKSGASLQPQFKDGALVFAPTSSTFGVWVHPLNLPQAKRVVIEWGVLKYPKPMNWKKDNKKRDAFELLLSFGKEKLPSGSFLIPNAPRFIGYFIGKKEPKNKIYTGAYHKEGGRYISIESGNLEGQNLTTEISLEKTYKNAFGTKMLPISGIAFEVDARDSSKGSKAFIKKITFYDE